MREEAWLSGRKRLPAKKSKGKPFRRFESFRLRRNIKSAEGRFLYSEARKDSNEGWVGRGTTGPLPYRKVLETEGFQSADLLRVEQFDYLPPPQNENE